MKKTVKKKVNKKNKETSTDKEELVNQKIDEIKKIIQEKTDIIQKEVTKPSAWFRNVAHNEHVSNSYMWKIDKERIYNNYDNVIKKIVLNDGNVITVPLNQEPKCEHEKQTVHSIEIILPSGKVITPIRQFCETKVLPDGTLKANFYDFSTKYKDMVEGSYNNSVGPTVIRTSANPFPKGSRINIEYEDIEKTEISIVGNLNRSFALESINDETRVVFNAVKDNKDVPLLKGKLTFEKIIQMRRIIEENGLDTSNLIIYTTGNEIRSLISSPEIYSCIGGLKPNIITQHTIERILGVKLVRTFAAHETKTKLINVKESYWQRFKRVLLFKKQPTKEETYEISTSLLFVPNVAFGIVCGKSITMEAQRRNELQAISVTGTNRGAAVVKNTDACVRLVDE